LKLVGFHCITVFELDIVKLNDDMAVQLTWRGRIYRSLLG